jgi:hypothetical protein
VSFRKRRTMDNAQKHNNCIKLALCLKAARGVEAKLHSFLITHIKRCDLLHALFIFVLEKEK